MRFSAAAMILLLMTGSAFADKSELLGKWEVVSLIRDGKMDDSMKGAIREHIADRYIVTPKDGKAISGSYVVEGKSIDMSPSSGRYQGQKLLGVYELKGDILTIAFTTEPGKDRPTGLDPKPGIAIVVLKKLK